MSKTAEYTVYDKIKIIWNCFFLLKVLITLTCMLCKEVTVETKCGRMENKPKEGGAEITPTDHYTFRLLSHFSLPYKK